jgi:hypothetical protein
VRRLAGFSGGGGGRGYQQLLHRPQHVGVQQPCRVRRALNMTHAFSATASPAVTGAAVLTPAAAAAALMLLPRVNCMSYILCCRKSLAADPDEDAASSAPTVVRLARVFGDMFYPLNFSFTDTVAAITLVGITHRSSAHGHGSSSHNHALIAAAGAGVLGAAKHDAAALGAGALLEAAVAAAAARQAKTSSGPTCLLTNSAKAADHGHKLSADGHMHTEAARTGGDNEPGRMHLQLAACQAAAVSAAEGTGAAPAATSGAQDTPLVKGIKHSSSTGNLQAPVARGGSPTPLEPTAVSFARSGSSSAWEAAVRQGSALAVAPGRGFVPGSGLGSSSNRTPSPGPEAVASLPARSHSTAADPSAGFDPGPSPFRFSHRAVSWGGTGPSSQPPSGRSSEQGAARPHTPGDPVQQSAKPQQMVLSSLAEANELSLAHSNVLGQVQSLLSPLASYEASGEALAAINVTGQPPAGAAAAGDAVGAAAAGLGTDPQLIINPLFSDSLSQPGQGRALQQQQQGSAGAAPGNDVVAALAVTSAGAVPPETTTAAAAAVAAAAAAAEGAGALTSTGQPVPLDLLEEALHWHAYANAIYGWPMFLWSHRYRCAADMLAV